MTPPYGKPVLRVPDEAASVLRKLHPVIKSHIRSGLQAILADPFSGKALKDELEGLRSYRLKRFRFIYRIDTLTPSIEIITVGPRKVIYEETFRILSKK